MSLIRTATVSDAQAIAELLNELGYPASPTLVLQKIERLSASDHDAVYVAEISGGVAGVIGLHTTELLHCSGRLGRITALVVSSGKRGSGIGKALLEAADGYFLKQDCIRAEVTSGDHRITAHAFYQSNGYSPDERRFVKPTIKHDQ
jgi:N-acetylglutamate synthase-like GNAT family acetyltransferase